jgi:DNA helicase-2/ATP-dependent DNA helicase PcrA
MDLSSLNPAQAACVTAPDGYHLVVAGAGTGKTKTLVHRVAWLVEHGVYPREIVLLTFTRRAADEMLWRVANLVDHAHGVRGGTFHSFAVTALRRHAEAIGFTREFTILDRGDSEELLSLVRSDLGAGGKGRRFPKTSTLAAIIGKNVNTGLDFSEIMARQYPQYEDDADDVAKIAAAFEQRKRVQNLMDFDDLLVRLLELVRDHHGPRQDLSEGIRHLLVDEYQDTNALQAQIAGLLSYVHGNLMVVGDEAQSIYRFRGAEVRNILDFQVTFPGAAVWKLEQNYRSNQPILDLANGVLESASEGYRKVLYSDRKVGDRPRLVEVYDEGEQAEYVVQRVLELRESGTPLSSIAVLFRSGYHANLLEVGLARAKVPFRKFGGVRFAEAAHVKDVFALLRIIANPRDGLAWSRVLKWFEGVGPKAVETMLNDILAHGALDPSPYKGKKYGGAVAYLAGVLEDAVPLRGDLEALVEHVLEYYRPFLPHLYEDQVKRVKDLESIRQLATQATDLDTLLAEVVLDPPDAARGDDPEDEQLTLSTIHSAKGLEWRSVIILALADGFFPAGQNAEDDESMEEERRLLYVAVTRAERDLDLMQPRVLRTRWGAPGGGGCALLDEIPDLENRVETMRWRPAEPPPASKHPDIVAAEARLNALLALYGRKK